MQKKKTTENEELYGELGQAFNFTRGDLEANRAGFLSHRQKYDLAINSDGCLWWYPFFAMFSLFIVMILNVLVFNFGISLDMPLLAMSSGAVLAFGIGFIGFGAIRVYEYIYKKNERNLIRFDNLAAYKKFVATTHYPATLSDEQKALLRARPKFRIYAMPTNKKILSLEAADEA